MIVIETLLCFFALALWVPVAVLFTQVVMAVPGYRARPMPAGRRPRVAVVVPAHDEALVIAATLRAIVPQLLADDRLLVVADNCVDDTARIAAAAGAEVLERADRERRGKGYALDFGVRELTRNPPEVLLIIDADCETASGTIERLARRCVETGRPVQALDLMLSPAGAGLKTRIAEFAWLVKNQVRALGFHRLGLPCQLMGTGMAFPWAIINDAALASGHIAEDLKLGIDLAHAGKPAVFCPEARVTSYFPATAQGISAQRTRWEHGHLQVILSIAPRLVLEALRRGDRNLFALALDLCVPPLALLLLLVLTVFVACAVLFAVTALPLPLWLATAALAIFGLSVLLAWFRYGRQVISLSSLVYAPLYALWKIPLYLKFMAKRQVDWVRSRRDGN
ncbi:MAG: glycosyltransferase family protein [Betaproteobacteria bacterium]|nr:glycosyltransferase family protein [Betaproteobacteria bacterium]